ncbi:MAG: Xaa-Pro peptidase family protein [Candidatus Micrarchaeota archaeon]
MRFPFRDCGSVLLFNPEVSEGIDANFYKHAQADVDGSALFWNRKGKILLTSSMNEGKARKLCKFKVMRLASGGLSATVKKLAGRGTLGLDFDKLSARRFLSLEKLMGGRKRLVDVSERLDGLRMPKDKEELSRISKAVKITLDILEGLELRRGMRESDVVRALGRTCLENDVGFSFPPIVAYGPNAGNPHHTPTDKRIGEGVVLIDFGVRYKQYCSDISRCFFIGPAKEEQHKYEECIRLHDAILDKLHTCRTSGDYYSLAEKERERIGWPKMIHSIGHGLGLDVHEAPHVYMGSKEKLQEGAVLTIEPGWYSEKFGVRYENDIVWSRKKARML